MKLFEITTTIPHPIEEVFALTVDLEHAPRWHSFFTNVRQLTANPIGTGSQWEMNYGVGKFVLEVIDYQPPRRVVFKGSPIMGIVPNFTVEFQAIAQGTEVHYLLHPDTPLVWRPFMAIFAPPYGKRDLKRYFRELNSVLAHHT